MPFYQNLLVCFPLITLRPLWQCHKISAIFFTFFIVEIKTKNTFQLQTCVDQFIDNTLGSKYVTFLENVLQNHWNMKLQTCQYWQRKVRHGGKGKHLSPGIHFYVKIGKLGIPYTCTVDPMHLQGNRMKFGMFIKCCMKNWAVRIYFLVE